MKKLIALILITTLLLCGCSLFGQADESGSLSDKLSGLDRSEQRTKDTAEAPVPEDVDPAKAPANTAQGINGSFDQMELVMELLSNTVTPENRDGGGEFGLSTDMDEVERHRRMNPENDAMPDNYIYTTTWTGAEQGFGADWKISIYFREAYTAYECRYSLDGMDDWDAIDAASGALRFSSRNYYRYEGEPYSSDSYWVEGIGTVDDASEFQSIYQEKIKEDEDFVCVYTVNNPRRYNPSWAEPMGIDSDVIDEISVNIWRFEGETFLDCTYVNHFDTPSESGPEPEPSASESSASQASGNTSGSGSSAGSGSISFIGLVTYDQDPPYEGVLELVDYGATPNGSGGYDCYVTIANWSDYDVKVGLDVWVYDGPDAVDADIIELARPVWLYMGADNTLEFQIPATGRASEVMVEYWFW